MKTSRRAAEIIAFHCGMDLAEMNNYRYQSTMWKNPAVYSMDFETDGKRYSFLAAPSSNKMPRNYAEMSWVKIGQEYGRSIFGSTDLPT